MFCLDVLFELFGCVMELDCGFVLREVVMSEVMIGGVIVVVGCFVFVCLWMLVNEMVCVVEIVFLIGLVLNVLRCVV